MKRPRYQNQRTHVSDLTERFLSGIGVPEKVTFVPDKFQLDAIEAIANNCDALVIAPTGSGKTYIATQAIRTIVEQGKRAIYTTPLKALSNSKYSEFKKIYEPTFRVGLLTGDRKIDGDGDVVIATTEIYRNNLYSSSGEYGLVVLDEIHYLADPQRGPVWEESIILSARSSNLLMLSASISNAEEVAKWIKEVRGKEVRIIQETKRPVELRLGFLHPDLGVMPIEEKKDHITKEVYDFYRHQADSPSYGRFKRQGRGRTGGSGR